MLSLVFIVTFVLCFAIAILCFLVGHELLNTYKAVFYRFYFYYLLAFFVFAIYSFWGQIGIQALMVSFETTEKVVLLVSGSIPLFSLPFFIIAMIMFLRMAFALVEQPLNTRVHYFHFIVCLIIAIVIYALYELTNGIAFFVERSDFPLMVFLIIELLYLLFFTVIVMLHVKYVKPKKSQVIRHIIVLLYIGFLFRSSSLVFNEVAKWVLPFLILIYFLSHIMALWYIRQYSDNLFEPLGAELPNTVKKEQLYLRYQITSREQEVIEQICLGKTNQQIADTLFISLQTVKDHTHRIYTKVGINSRMKLVQMLNA